MSVIGLTKGGREWNPHFIEAVNPETCIGCGRCYKVCSRDVFDLKEKSDVMDVEDDDEPVPYVKCPKCSWPLCSLECAQKPIHAAECFFLSKVCCRYMTELRPIL